MISIRFPPLQILVRLGNPASQIPIFNLGSVFAWKVVLSFYLWAFLSLKVPSKQFLGPKSPEGEVPRYAANGTQFYLVSLAAYFALGKDLLQSYCFVCFITQYCRCGRAGDNMFVAAAAVAAAPATSDNNIFYSLGVADVVLVGDGGVYLHAYEKVFSEPRTILIEKVIFLSYQFGTCPGSPPPSTTTLATSSLASV